MKIISTNIGEKTKIRWKGKEVLTGIYKYPVNECLTLSIANVENDNVIDRKYHGGKDKACYIYSGLHYPDWKIKYPNLDWQYGMFGENLTISNFNESEINIGDIFKLGSALVQITQPRQPCFKLGIRLNNSNAVKTFVNEEKPGAYVRIIEPGKVKTGDTMQLIEPKIDNFTLTEIFHFIYNATENIEQIKKAIKMPELAESCRNDLIKYGKLSV